MRALSRKLEEPEERSSPLMAAPEPALFGLKRRFSVCLVHTLNCVLLGGALLHWAAGPATLLSHTQPRSHINAAFLLPLPGFRLVKNLNIQLQTELSGPQAHPFLLCL